MSYAGSCRVNGCDAVVVYAYGMCSKHYQRWRRHGTTDRERRAFGEGSIRSDGYVIKSINRKLYREHVIIAEEVLGKPLPKGAVVHHIDGNRANNKPTNLVICPDQSYHRMMHIRAETLSNKFALYDELCEKYFSWEKDFGCDEDDYSFYSDDGRML